MNTGRLFDEFSGRIADSNGLHPLAQGAVHHKTQETNENVGLDSLSGLVKNGANPHFTFQHPKCLFDFRQLNVGLPQILRILLVSEIGPQ